MSKAQDTAAFPYREGDLLLQDIDCGDLCDAIETVTPSWQGKHFSHVGIVHLKNDSVYVLEAIGKDVHLTPLPVFLDRQRDRLHRPKVVLGRLRQKHRHLIHTAMPFALAQLGVPYDEDFLYGNGKYYCSELVYDAFKAANDSKPFFQLHPMTFKDPATQQYFPAWISYYTELRRDIPEEKPGCNPGSIANDEKLEIIRSFY